MLVEKKYHKARWNSSNEN